MSPENAQRPAVLAVVEDRLVAFRDALVSVFALPCVEQKPIGSPSVEVVAVQTSGLWLAEDEDVWCLGGRFDTAVPGPAEANGMPPAAVDILSPAHGRTDGDIPCGTDRFTRDYLEAQCPQPAVRLIVPLATAEIVTRQRAAENSRSRETDSGLRWIPLSSVKDLVPCWWPEVGRLA